MSSFRRYQSSDQAACLAICAAAIPDFLGPVEQGWYEEDLRTGLDPYFVFSQDERVVACGGLTARPEQQAAEIRWLLVAPELRAAGLGRRFIEFLEGTALEAFPFARRINAISNERSYRFYERCGFRLAGISEDEYSPGLRNHYMEKELNR